MKIKLYSIKGCHNCLLVRNYFDRMKMQYEIVDCDKNLEESLKVMKEAGSEQLPIIKYTINSSSNLDKPILSNSYMIGYNEENLNKLFKLIN